MKGSGAEPPEGLLYVPDFLTEAQEHELLTHVRHVAFSEIRMHGQVARRRTGAPVLHHLPHTAESPGASRLTCMT